MDFWTAVKYVLAVIAIMAVAGGIVYLLSGVVINVFEKKTKTEQPKEAKPVERKEQTLLLENSKEEMYEEQPVLEEAQELEGESINLDLAEEEQRAINEQRNELAERARIVEEAQTEEEPVEDEDINDIYQRMIAEINAEALQDNEAENEEESMEDEDMLSDEDLDRFIGEINDEEDEELEEVVEENEELDEQPEEPVEEAVEPAEEPTEEVVDNEKEDLRKLVEELKLQLAKEQAEKAAQEKEVEVVDGESLESLTSRLEVLNERLSQSEKELKANKKEYLPLLKIKKTLENDKAKLRRKEAVVAKQKVVLFGVNNYVVDPEKEKKLNEDLDLLDALRLSVQHCEEVIKDNEDRYPILEKTNNILTRQIEDLKSDIADVKAKIDAKSTTDKD